MCRSVTQKRKSGSAGPLDVYVKYLARTHPGGRVRDSSKDVQCEETIYRSLHMYIGHSDVSVGSRK